ncbi:MAG: hypothetical protein NT001_07695 [Candidatus Woesearchaeota archaeon]|nr:hypothetical protein [Candidatus Woesearchaeota archaeon]
MKLSNKILDDVIIEVAGEDVLPLVKAMKNKKNVSEFKLAEKMKVEVNIMRNMLYRLYKSNLVSFIRKKDKVKGWYIYYWTFRAKNIKYLALELKKKKMAQLKERLEREKGGHFYMCPTKCMRLNFDQAVDFSFKCPECGSLMEMDNNKDKIREIEKEIKEIEIELKKR